MPTLAQYTNAASDVFPGGSTLLEVQFDTYINSGIACQASNVTLGITASGAADGGEGTPLAPSSDITELGMGLYSYTWDVPDSQTPGTYLATWTGTRVTDSETVEYVQVINVAAATIPVPIPGVYASVLQYQAWSGDTWTPPSRVQIALQRASEQIDIALVAAVYRTDADGMPLDAEVANVLVRATSAQAQYLIAVNDDANVKREYSSLSVGGISSSRTSRMQSMAMPPIAPQALAILRVAGVLPSAPLINW